MDSFANGHQSKSQAHVVRGPNFSHFSLLLLSSQSRGPNIELRLQCVAGRTEAQDPIRSHEALQDSGKISSSPV